MSTFARATLLLAGLLAAAIGHASPPVAAGSATPVPAALVLSAESGEGVYDAARANDWPEAGKQLQALRSTLPAIGPGPDAGRLQTAIAALTADVAARQRHPVLRDANEVTRLVAQLTAPYNPPVPTAIVMLDYYGRELQLWAESGNRRELAATKAAILRTWHEIRSDVVAHGGSRQADAFDGQVGQVEQAVRPADYRKIAASFLDQVDELEKVYGS